jgi:hypothetical protein
MRKAIFPFLPIFSQHLMYKVDQPFVPTRWENILDISIHSYTEHITHSEARAAVASIFYMLFIAVIKSHKFTGHPVYRISSVYISIVDCFFCWFLDFLFMLNFAMFSVSHKVHLITNWLVWTLFAAFGVFVGLCRDSGRNRKKFGLGSHSPPLVALHGPSKGICA